MLSERMKSSEGVEAWAQNKMQTIHVLFEYIQCKRINDIWCTLLQISHLCVCVCSPMTKAHFVRDSDFKIRNVKPSNAITVKRHMCFHTNNRMSLAWLPERQIIMKTDIETITTKRRLQFNWKIINFDSFFRVCVLRCLDALRYL